MSCTQKRQLVRFPKVRILKQWFRHFNDHKEFHTGGNAVVKAPHSNIRMTTGLHHLPASMMMPSNMEYMTIRKTN